MNTRKWVCALIVGSSCWIACSSEEEEEAPLSPQQRCEEFVERFCVRRAECEPSTYQAEYYDECDFALDLELDCTKYTASTDSSACFETLDRASCEQLQLGLPSSCGEAFFR